MSWWLIIFFREGRAKVMPLKAYLVQRMKLGIVKGKLAAWTIKRLKADNDNVTEETTTGFAGLAPEGAEDYTALAGHSGAMEEVAQGRQVDEAQVPQGTASVSVQGSAGTSVSLAAPSLGSATLNARIRPVCTNHSLNTYYATDHLGTVRFTKTIDETGTEVATSSHDYEPFGVEITPTDACDNTHKYTGQERDAETQNDYMHFRFFSASMGRFQKPDSNFDGAPYNPQGFNLYSYVRGNPVNFNDPLGHARRVGPGGRSAEPIGGGFLDSTLGQDMVLSDYEAYQQMMDPQGMNMGLGAAMAFSGVADNMTTSESSATLGVSFVQGHDQILGGVSGVDENGDMVLSFYKNYVEAGWQIATPKVFYGLAATSGINFSGNLGIFAGTVGFSYFADNQGYRRILFYRGGGLGVTGAMASGSIGKDVSLLFGPGTIDPTGPGFQYGGSGTALELPAGLTGAGIPGTQY